MKSSGKVSGVVWKVSLVLLFWVAASVAWPSALGWFASAPVLAKPGTKAGKGPKSSGVSRPRTRIPAGTMRVFDRGAGPVEMIYIPRSTFTMGYDGGELERPSHEVTLKPYWIDKTEVTIAQYKRCLKAKKCKRHSRIAKDLSKKSIQLKMLSSMCNRRYKDRDQHPVNCVSYKRASTFCKFRGARLPTEAEWEYAARGSKGRTLPWGAGAPTCNRAVVNDDGYGCGRVSTWAVGSKKNGISPFGLHDTMGNVAEWVKDWHGPYTPLPEFNPRGPRKSEAEIPLRVYRGGGMLENTNVWPRVTMRRGIEPRTRRPDLGFRCAKRAI